MASIGRLDDWPKFISYNFRSPILTLQMNGGKILDSVARIEYLFAHHPCLEHYHLGCLESGGAYFKALHHSILYRLINFFKITKRQIINETPLDPLADPKYNGLAQLLFINQSEKLLIRVLDTPLFLFRLYLIFGKLDEKIDFKDQVNRSMFSSNLVLCCLLLLNLNKEFFDRLKLDEVYCSLAKLFSIAGNLHIFMALISPNRLGTYFGSLLGIFDSTAYNQCFSRKLLVILNDLSIDLDVRSVQFFIRHCSLRELDFESVCNHLLLSSQRPDFDYAAFGELLGQLSDYDNFLVNHSSIIIRIANSAPEYNTNLIATIFQLAHSHNVLFKYINFISERVGKNKQSSLFWGSLLHSLERQSVLTLFFYNFPYTSRSVLNFLCDNLCSVSFNKGTMTIILSLFDHSFSRGIEFSTLIAKLVDHLIENPQTEALDALLSYLSKNASLDCYLIRADSFLRQLSTLIIKNAPFSCNYEIIKRICRLNPSFFVQLFSLLIERAAFVLKNDHLFNYDFGANFLELLDNAINYEPCNNIRSYCIDLLGLLPCILRNFESKSIELPLRFTHLISLFIQSDPFFYRCVYPSLVDEVCVFVHKIASNLHVALPSRFNSILDLISLLLSFKYPYNPSLFSPQFFCQLYSKIQGNGTSSMAASFFKLYFTIWNASTTIPSKNCRVDKSADINQIIESKVYEEILGEVISSASYNDLLTKSVIFLTFFSSSSLNVVDSEADLVRITNLITQNFCQQHLHQLAVFLKDALDIYAKSPHRLEIVWNKLSSFLLNLDWAAFSELPFVAEHICRFLFHFSMSHRNGFSDFSRTFYLKLDTYAFMRSFYMSCKGRLEKRDGFDTNSQIPPSSIFNMLSPDILQADSFCERFHDWSDELLRNLICASPLGSIRALANLDFDSLANIKQKILNYAFYSLFISLISTQQQTLVFKVSQILELDAIPPNFTVLFLNLIEFFLLEGVQTFGISVKCLDTIRKHSFYSLGIYLIEKQIQSSIFRGEYSDTLAYFYTCRDQDKFSKDTCNQFSSSLLRPIPPLLLVSSNIAGGLDGNPDLSKSISLAFTLGRWDSLHKIIRSSNCSADFFEIISGSLWLSDGVLSGDFVREPGKHPLSYILLDWSVDSVKTLQMLLEDESFAISNKLVSVFPHTSSSVRNSAFQNYRKISILQKLVLCNQSPINHHLLYDSIFRDSINCNDISSLLVCTGLKKLYPYSGLPSQTDALRFSKHALRLGYTELALTSILKLLKVDSAADINQVEASNSNVLLLYSLAKSLRKLELYILPVKILTKIIKCISNTKDFGNGHDILLSKCHLKLASWLQLHDESSNRYEIMDHLIAASSYSSTSFKAWHDLASINQQFALARKNAQTSANSCILTAIKCLLKAISCSSDPEILFDELRFISLWLKYDYFDDVNAMIGDSIDSIPISRWLDIFPQLLSRASTPNKFTRRLILGLSENICISFPHRTLMHVISSVNSLGSLKKAIGRNLLEKLQLHDNILVQDYLTFSSELIRISLFRDEMWYEGINAASVAFFNEHNINSMISALSPLIELNNCDPSTFHEKHFMKLYGDKLKSAFSLCMRYKRSGETKDITRSWEMLFEVHKQISRQINSVSLYHLGFISPLLHKLKNSKISLPLDGRGSTNTQKSISIASFKDDIVIISSKQRPRKITFTGSDGMDYAYLIKGKEDLRQDQRLFQLFDVINHCFRKDHACCLYDLKINILSITPLSNKAGLVGWIDQSDTLCHLIKSFREKFSKDINSEQRAIFKFAPFYERLSPLAKTEAFSLLDISKDALDLHTIFFITSSSSNEWYARRKAFMSSSAVMSMVGYIIGLGDRHPSNILINRDSGSICHIDFGDCFETANKREKYPEKVSFRVTKMIEASFGPFGLHGFFKDCSEHALRILRSKSEVLIEILESFIYDPLLNWCLFNPGTAPGFLSSESPSSSFIENSSEYSQGSGALNTISRISDKLKGTLHFPNAIEPKYLSVSAQAKALILDSSSPLNIAQSFIGWCPFW